MNEETIAILIASPLEAQDTTHQAQLEEAGFVLVRVESATDIKASIAQNDFSAALVSLNRSHEGLDIIQLIREAEKSLPVVILAVEPEAPLSEAVTYGASHFLEYATSFSLLHATLHACHLHFRANSEILLRHDRFQRALEGSRDGLWDWNLATNWVYYSKEWLLLFGLRPGDVVNEPRDWFQLIHPDDLAPLRSRLAVHLEGVTPHFESQCRMRSRAGAFKWVLCRGVLCRDESGKVVRITGTITDLSKRSHHDVRTGLPFRSFFVERLNQAIVQSQLSPTRFFSVLHVDVDRFTTISEGFGHDMVDGLLVAFAQRVELCLKQGDTLAYLGGNSFVILLEDQADLKAAQEVANQVHMQLIAPFRVNITDVFSKASIGIVGVDGNVNSPDETLRQAHGAMKAARNRGSGHTMVWDKEMESKTREYLEMESQLRSALDNQEFRLCFQPQVSMTTGQIVGAEALIRWHRSDGSVVSPGLFIPIAEETDLILTIGEWVLRTACRQAFDWQARGLPPIRVAVNLSERQFRARNLFGMVDQVLKDTGLPPELLELEITESIFMEDLEGTSKTLNAFSQRGIKIALDDFGTGFSSLSYLKRFPITTLKIDRSFVTDLTSDPGDAAICSTIISLAHKFNFSVIAEGVETKEQLIILRAFQCDEIQGFYFSKALPPEQLEQLMKLQSDSRLWQGNSLQDNMPEFW